MRHKLRKLLCGMVLLCFILAFPPWSWAYVSEDYADLPGIKVGDKVVCQSGSSSKVPSSTARHDGVVTIVDSNTGRTLGQGMLLNFPKPGSASTDGYTMLRSGLLRSWIAEFGGSLEFVQANYQSYKCTLTWGSKVAERMHVRDLSKLCGTGYGWYDQSTKTVYFAVTRPPNASIYGPLEAAPGQAISVRVSGSSNVTSGFNGVSYELNVNGAYFASQSYPQNSFSDTKSYTVPSNAAPGSTITFELTVKDGVWRASTKTLTVKVVANPQPPPPQPPEPPPYEPPPPPPPPDMEPVADFTVSNPNPEENEGVTLRDASEHPGEENGEKIVSWTWDIQGIGTKTGKTVTVSWPVAGTYRITLTVTDEDGDSDSKTKSVVVAAAPPVANISVSPKTVLAGRQVAVSGDESVAGGGRTVVLDLNEWEIRRPDGSLKWSGTQRYPIDPPPPAPMFDSVGRWKVRLRVTDSGGYKSEWSEETVEVLPDQPPVADFWVANTAARNVVDGYSLTVQDRSFVPQPDTSMGDEISKREWTLYYDKNNNGSFGDAGDEVILPGDTGKSAAIFQASENDPQPRLEFYQTGRYKLELRVIERWYGWGAWWNGLSGDTLGKPLDQELVVVVNLAPAAGFNAEPKPAVLFSLPPELAGWQYAKEIVVTNTGDRNLSDYQVRMIVDTATEIAAGRMRSDCGDVRFVIVDGTGLASAIPYFMDGAANTATTPFWVKVPSLPSGETTKVYMLYGKPDAQSASSGPATFEAFLYGYLDTFITSVYYPDQNYVNGSILYVGGWRDSYYSLLKIPTELVPGYVTAGNLEQMNLKMLWWGQNPSGSTRTQTAYLRKINSSWDPSTVTWNTRPSIDSGNIIAFSKTLPSPGFYNWNPVTPLAWESFGITGWARGWLSGSYPNHGLAWLPSNTGGVWIDFASENNDVFLDYHSHGTTVTGLQPWYVTILFGGGNELAIERSMSLPLAWWTRKAASPAPAISVVPGYMTLTVETDSLPNVLLVRQKADFRTSYGDAEQDPKVGDQWYYEHDPEHLMGYDLSNSWGLNTDVHQKTFSEPVTSFSKPGTYIVRYRAQDQPPNSLYWDDPDAGRKWSQWTEMEVHVHRRPVAQFAASPSDPVTGEELTYTDYSYDPDMENTDPLGQKGVRGWEWQYRVGDGEWIPSDGPPPYLAESGATYTVRLRVQDALGAWSGWAYAELTAQNRAPVAYFERPAYVGVNQAATLSDGSWDPDGDEIVAWEWTVTGKGVFNTQDVTVSWASAGTYPVTLRVQDSRGAWSSPFTQDIVVSQPNNPPVARLSGPGEGYTEEPLTLSGTSSYDPDPGDYIARAFWRYCKPGGDWTGYFTQNRGDSGFLTFTVTPDVAGQWQFELVVEDSRGAESSPAYFTVAVEEGFEVAASVVPASAERGRKMKVTAWAERPSSGEKIQIDSMRVYIPHTVRPDGQPALASGEPHLAGMTWDPGTKMYVYEYLIPNRTVSGYWSDDGSYYLRVVGVKNSTQKEKLVTLTIKGHVFNRRIIRTYKW